MWGRPSACAGLSAPHLLVAALLPLRHTIVISDRPNCENDEQKECVDPTDNGQGNA
jgi:hypothetical protein